MTTTKEIIPSQAIKSNCNERHNDIDKESEEYQHILKTIKNSGISNKPLARMENGTIAIVDGWHRVKAAEDAQLDKITVNLEENISEVEAMKKSLYGNLDEARTTVAPRDRALHLQTLWDTLEDTSGTPSASRLADELGVARSTVQRWLERLNDNWESTLIDPTSDNQRVHSEHLTELSDRKLASIRHTTDGGTEGEWLAIKTVENDFSSQDITTIREHVEHGASLENAVKVATGDLSIEDTQAEYQNQTPDTVNTTATTDSPDSPTSPPSPTTTQSTSTDGGTDTERTSTAELSQPDSDSWTDQLNEQPPTPSITPTEDTDSDSDSSTETEERTPLVTEEAMEQAQDIQGTADLQEEIEESSEEDGCLHFEFTVSGALAEASKKAIDEGFNNPEKLGEEAVKNFLLGSPWMNAN